MGKRNEAGQTGGREAAMPREKRAADVVVIGVPEGTCGCGCGLEVKKGSRFRIGHDAKLKSVLGRAHKDGVPVAIVADGTRRESSAQALLVERNWPVPAVPKPKAPKVTPAARQSRTRKPTTAKS